MESPFCDVIGCGERARWKLARECEPLPDQPLPEEYLCDAHRNELARLQPDLAGRYVPLEQES